MLPLPALLAAAAALAQGTPANILKDLQAEAEERERQP